MLVLVLSLHTFVRMPEIAKKKKKKRRKMRRHTFLLQYSKEQFERTVLEYEKVGLKAWFLLNTRIIRKQRV